MQPRSARTTQPFNQAGNCARSSAPTRPRVRSASSPPCLAPDFALPLPRTGAAAPRTHRSCRSPTPSAQLRRLHGSVPVRASPSAAAPRPRTPRAASAAARHHVVRVSDAGPQGVKVGSGLHLAEVRLGDHVANSRKTADFEHADIHPADVELVPLRGQLAPHGPTAPCAGRASASCADHPRSRSERGACAGSPPMPW